MRILIFYQNGFLFSITYFSITFWYNIYTKIVKMIPQKVIFSCKRYIL